MTITQITESELRLAGEAKVLRDLLAEALAVLDTVDGYCNAEWMVLTAIRTRISAVLNPPVDDGLPIEF
jgi:hypothetical protein